MPPALIIFYEQTRKLHELTEKRIAFSVLNRRYLTQTPNATVCRLSPTSCIKACGIAEDYASTFKSVQAHQPLTSRKT